MQPEPTAYCAQRASDTRFDCAIHGDVGVLLVMDEEWASEKLPDENIIVKDPSGEIEGIKRPKTPPMDELDKLLAEEVVDPDKWDDRALDTVGAARQDILVIPSRMEA
ncbi:hypothetical protein BC829DRAFT_387748 [Chytridium lagenaria]|nr:hypothetical protein BC829DRAFT_387748 [Chytridium lagenaria]